MTGQSAQHLSGHWRTIRRWTNLSPRLIANSLYQRLAPLQFWGHTPHRCMTLMPLPGLEMTTRLATASSYWRVEDTCIHRIPIVCDEIDFLWPCCIVRRLVSSHLCRFFLRQCANAPLSYAGIAQGPIPKDPKL